MAYCNNTQAQEQEHEACGCFDGSRFTMRRTCQRRGCGSSDQAKSFRGHGKADGKDASAAPQRRFREILYLLRWMPDGVRLMQFLGKMFLQRLLHCLSAAMVAEPAVKPADATRTEAN